MFRSLFWWIILVDLILGLLNFLLTGVSILVLVDHSRRRVFVVGEVGATWMFRSLFWWIILVDSA